MAYIKVECSVARNRKFVKAGPGPSWLWLCGLAYCQEGLTDGFIPDEAIEFLGVRSARHLIKHLVSAGLWDAVDGGWRVHDYLDHNKSADEVADIRERRGTGGKRGGRPKKNLSENLPETSKVSQVETLQETFPASVSVAASVAEVVVVGGAGDAPPMDLWWQQLTSEYPQNRVQRNVRTQQAFMRQMLDFKGGPREAWGLLRSNLDANRNSHEWHKKGMVPWLYRYLDEGLWQNALAVDAPVAEQLSPRTMRMLGGTA